MNSERNKNTKLIQDTFINSNKLIIDYPIINTFLNLIIIIILIILFTQLNRDTKVEIDYKQLYEKFIEYQSSPKSVNNINTQSQFNEQENVCKIEEINQIFDNNIHLSVSKNNENEIWEGQEKQSKYTQFIGKIHQSISITQFDDFEMIYNQKFTYPMTDSVFQYLFDKIFDTNIDPLICIGAEKDSQFILVACDLATEVFEETKNKYMARQSKNGQIFWYYFKNKSFGFSQSIEINLNICDIQNQQDDLRFCISIKKDNNQRRIGKLIDLKEIEDYNLKIYMIKQ